MKLTSVPENPPNWKRILKIFPSVEFKTGVLYSWGDKIYNPSKANIPLWLLAHECVHSKQHEQVGGPEAWWDLYLVSRTFRLDQEVNAHRVEIESYAEVNNRAMRKLYIRAVAERLSGDLYGNLVKLKKARHLLTMGMPSYEHKQIPAKLASNEPAVAADTGS